ncbi:MAG: hypothetical protein HYS09_04490 [Chloroflexi bacterium]|nr:hypothetical protein [Chloroflexota bacterium]
MAEMAGRYGAISRLPNTQSLYELGRGQCRVYIRYSKLHPRAQTFFGLRREDLRQLEGHKSFISFLWDGQLEPLLVPFAEFEEVFAEAQPASDGQFKIQVYPREDGTILYIARAGRFNVEGYFGWLQLEAAMKGFHPYPSLSHPQIQTLLGAIGAAKDYDVWVPRNDRAGLDWSLASPYRLADELTPGFEAIQSVLQEIDVIWLKRGSAGLAAVYEVEHSTPIYSGLLRLNDVRLINPQIDRLTVVSNEPRRATFVRQLNRPTFQASSLSSVCTFLEYSEVYDWHRRLTSGGRSPSTEPSPHRG